MPDGSLFPCGHDAPRLSNRQVCTFALWIELHKVPVKLDFFQPQIMWQGIKYSSKNFRPVEKRLIHFLYRNNEAQYSANAASMLFNYVCIKKLWEVNEDRHFFHR